MFYRNPIYQLAFIRVLIGGAWYLVQHNDSGETYWITTMMKDCITPLDNVKCIGIENN